MTYQILQGNNIDVLKTFPDNHFDSIVTDPFNGSGSTGCAAIELDYDYIGIELDPVYVKISNQRIAAWYEHTHTTTFSRLFESVV